MYMYVKLEKSRHPQSQGSVEHANEDTKDMLVAWMADNESQNWTTGIKFVQFQKNCAHQSVCLEYSVMFGSEARIGLTSSSLPHEVISTINNEAETAAVFPNNNMPICHDRNTMKDENTDMIHTRNIVRDEITDMIHTRNIVRDENTNMIHTRNTGRDEITDIESDTDTDSEITEITEF